MMEILAALLFDLFRTPASPMPSCAPAWAIQASWTHPNKWRSFLAWRIRS
jgi:hypothetical protein